MCERKEGRSMEYRKNEYVEGRNVLVQREERKGYRIWKEGRMKGKKGEHGRNMKHGVCNMA